MISQPILPNSFIIKSKNDYGFAFPIIPALACIVAISCIIISYTIAVDLGHAQPFPYTDITHTMIQYPEYIFNRIGFITSCLLMTFTFYLVAWFLQYSANQIPQNNINCRGSKIIKTGTFACFLLCLSTATCSDGGDMNWTLHVIGATGFFIVILYLFTVITGIVSKIWKLRPGFIPKFSYIYKKSVNPAIGGMLLIYLLNQLAGGLFPDYLGNVIEWIATFIVLIYVGTFSLDLWRVSVFFTEEQKSWEAKQIFTQ